MTLDVFYPIVPNCAWLARVAPLGIKTVQLRLKEAGPEETGRELLMALKLAAAYDIQLIINDHWQAAIDAGAEFIHLGQEDLAMADLGAISQAGLKLGVSTHSEDELETALRAAPSYVALGPIYETKLKAMAWAPQGLDRITQWKARLGAIPLVAIGGITPARAGAVLAAGADSVAVITDFMAAPHPEARASLWVDWAREQRGES
jgi:thiamine-phosphate pyrophosphorylase